MAARERATTTKFSPGRKAFRFAAAASSTRQKMNVQRAAAAADAADAADAGGWRRVGRELVYKLELCCDVLRRAIMI